MPDIHMILGLPLICNADTTPACWWFYSLRLILVRRYLQRSSSFGPVPARLL